MTDEPDTVELVTELTAAWLSNPNTRAAPHDVPGFLQAVHKAVSTLQVGGATQSGGGEAPEQFTAAVSVRKSLASPEHIISLIDGKPYRSLKRHLTAHGLTPEEYRQRYGLKATYPMVAPAYSQNRRETAKRIGLGRKASGAAAESGAERVSC